MNRILLLLFFLFFFSNSFSLDVSVGLKSMSNSSSITFIASGAPYDILSGKRKVITLRKDESVRIEIRGALMNLKKYGKSKGTFRKLKFIAEADSAFFRIRSNHPETATIPYDGNALLTIRNNYIQVVNEVPLERYVAAVVESEIGDRKEAEFLKACSILARTFVMCHWDRHSEEGFSVCDETHCQAYNSRNRFNSAIFPAVMETRNKVLTDSLCHVIAAPYHSNCGGQTMAAQDVWSKPLHNTRSVRDSFCLAGEHALWEFSLPKNEWIHYLKNNGILLTDTNLVDSLLCFNQDERLTYFNNSGASIPLRKIRDDFHLKSTFFSICIQNDLVIFSGRGFGHGVGLCQEGALEMALVGYTTKEILDFYFDDVRVTDLSELEYEK